MLITELTWENFKKDPCVFPVVIGPLIRAGRHKADIRARKQPLEMNEMLVLKKHIMLGFLRFLLCLLGYPARLVTRPLPNDTHGGRGNFKSTGLDVKRQPQYLTDKKGP